MKCFYLCEIWVLLTCALTFSLHRGSFVYKLQFITAFCSFHFFFLQLIVTSILPSCQWQLSITWSRFPCVQGLGEKNAAFMDTCLLPTSFFWWWMQTNLNIKHFLGVNPSTCCILKSTGNSFKITDASAWLPQITIKLFWDRAQTKLCIYLFNFLVFNPSWL